MALTKAYVAIQASASITPGSPVTATGVDLTAVYGGVLTWKITNGASAPTTVPTIVIQISHDGTTNWYQFSPTFGGDLVASSANSRSLPIPVGVMYIRSICTAGATNGSTMEVILEKVTAY
jgi:hypothetical protein